MTHKIFFKGPFSWHGQDDAPSVFDSDMANLCGIYLWMIPCGDELLINYVGETGRKFSKRLEEHYCQHASGMYRLDSSEGYSKGELVTVWPGIRGKDNKKSIKDCVIEYPKLCGTICELNNLYRFFLAEFSGEKRIRQRIESAIANHLYNTPGKVGDFMPPGVTYISRRDDEQSEMCKISSEVTIAGLPFEIEF